MRRTGFTLIELLVVINHRRISRYIVTRRPASQRSRSSKQLQK